MIPVATDQLHRGAKTVHNSDAGTTEPRKPPRLLAEVLKSCADREVSNLAALKSKASLLSDFLQKPADEITIDDMEDAKPSLRGFLTSRRMADNTIRTYVNEISILLKEAQVLGWTPDRETPVAWQAVMELCGRSGCADLCRYLLRRKKTPKLVTEDDFDAWMEQYVKSGRPLKTARKKLAAFRRVLVTAGVVEELPVSLKEGFGVPLDHLPPRLKEEVSGLMTWKQAKFSLGRPKKARIRAESAHNLKRAFCELYGFAVRVAGMACVESVDDLVTSKIVGQYIEWAINERKVRGQSLSSRLVVLKAALGQHPDYQDRDLAWLGPMIDGIPTDSASELKEKRVAKQIPYSVVETIPERIHRERRTAARRGDVALALCVRNELLMRWLTVLPWRQRNIRECRIEGPRPNIFKSKISHGSSIAKPKWVIEALQADPEAEFWQFKFAPEETKVGNDVHALIPRPLIPLLEEYLQQRKHLVSEIGAETLFLNEAGNKMSRLGITMLVGELTLRYVGKCVTPHTFRHIVAYAWLDAYPQDYLTLSKILFHTNINTTLKCYGAGFNESNGACGMERWVESRQSIAA